MATRPKIVARFTQEELDANNRHQYFLGYKAAESKYADAKRALEDTRERLHADQTMAVTKLIEACNANLSKAGYLIGKLNKDTSR